MEENIKNKIIESLEIQKLIFGEELYSRIELTEKPIEKKTSSILTTAEKITIESSSNLFAAEFENAQTLDELFKLIHTCQKCSLGQTRKNFVFGAGNPNANAMLIGEAPGADEDEQGEPFVGRAGQLLTKILSAINFQREDVYIANILKCRPPNNRNPLPIEMDTCRPYLLKQIELIKPKIILCLGLVAANNLLNKNSTLGNLRNNIYELNGIKVLVTFHPAALLRNPNWKKDCWIDVQNFRKLYDELVKQSD
ncbi:MAG: uracil-DNA glycosylase [Ignavibacteriales bacterium]|nr:uracil-DNA glycosylase [Ignavibacteriales bacterium]